MSEHTLNAGERLNQLLEEAGLERLNLDTNRRFDTYLSLILRWNARTNLTSVRDSEGILARHFIESITCARVLPAGIGTLLDFGSGAGFPGVPIALCRPEIAVTLAESQGKKAAFLREAMRALSIKVRVYDGRAETIQTEFDCVTLRAVDKMPQAVSSAAGLVKARGWLALMSTSAELAGLQAAAGTAYAWEPASVLPGAFDRIVGLGFKSGLSQR